MEAKPLDRRVQRTRRALHQALADLILEKRYDKITIQDIIDRANVGRSTFYTHFLDKEDLLEKGFVMFSDDLAALFENADHTQEESEHVLHSLIFFRHAGMHHELYRAMLEGGGAEVMMDAARRHLKIDIESHLGKLISDQPAGRDSATGRDQLSGRCDAFIVAMVARCGPTLPAGSNRRHVSTAGHGRGGPAANRPQRRDSRVGLSVRSKRQSPARFFWPAATF